MVEYANTAVDGTEGGSPGLGHSGESKGFRLVGLSFVLLCIMQLVLNVSLWRHTDPPARTCPLGWWQHMSSCYQLSTVASTWECAKQQCKDRGAHLVILEGPGEAELVHGLGRCLTVWTGLKCESGPSDQIWKWVNGSVLSGANWAQLPNVCDELNSCVFLDGRRSYSSFWFLGNCQFSNYWMCEMEL